MSEEVFVKVGVSLRQRLKELNDTELRVLIALGLRINNERQCWPSVNVLAEECTRSERQTQRAITKLLTKNFIWMGRRVGGRGKPNIYTLNGYFAYGSEPVQIVAPVMALMEQKGDMGVVVTRSKKGDIAIVSDEQKGDMGLSDKRVTSPQADQIRKKNHRRRTILRRTIAPNPVLTPLASLVSFSQWLDYLEHAPSKVGALTDAFKQFHPNAPVEDLGAGIGGRVAALYKLASKDYRRLLQAIWLAAAMPIVGSHLNYIQGMVRKEQHGQGPGLRAPGRDPEQAGPAFRSVTEEDVESGRARFDEQLHRVVWADKDETPG